MKLRLRALPTENRPRKSSRHCWVKVASSAWKHTSKLASSVNVVIMCNFMDGYIVHIILVLVISTRIIAASDYGDSFYHRAASIGKTCFYHVKIFTDSNERAHEE